MAGYTITEGLAELKTLQKRIAGKREGICRYLAYDSRVRDPLEKEVGGSRGFIERERQAVTDLEKRVVAIRTAIQRSNLTTTTTINGVTRNVAEWLTWRRELSEAAKTWLVRISNTIPQIRQQVQNTNTKLNAAANPPQEAGVAVINIDEAALHKELEAMEVTLGELDGKLSLLNATTVIEV